MRKVLINLLYKDLLDSWRNYKVLIIVITFLFFGLISPLSAYFMPQLLNMIGSDQGILIEINSPTQMDSYLQFHKNISQIALLIMIFLFMGNVSNEKESGSVDFLLVKPIKSSFYIISKFISLLILAFFAMLISTITCGFYTFFLFKTLVISDLLRMSFYLYFYIITILSITILFSSLVKKQFVAGIFTFLTWIIIQSLSSFSFLRTFLPTRVLNEAHLAAVGMSSNIYSIINSIIMILICLIIAIYGFKKQRDSL